MNKQIDQTQTVSIDIRYLFWKLIAQWKAILLVSLILAIFVCGAKYFKDSNTYKAEKEELSKTTEQSALPKEERIANVLDSLSSEDVMAVKVVINEKEWLSSLREYINNSVLMQTDPTYQRVVKMVLDIDAEDTTDIPVLMREYSIYIQSKDVIEAIKPLIDEKAKNEYIAELFYTEVNKSVETEVEGTSAALGTNLILPEGVDSGAVVSAINEKLEKKSAELQSRCKHSIKIFDAEEMHLYHKVNADNRVAVYRYLYDLGSITKINEANLTDIQRAAVESIETIKNTEAAAEGAEELMAPALSKKYALIGFILGAFLYIGLFITLLIFRGTINSPANVSAYTNSRMLGTVYYDNDSTLLGRIFHSKTIEKWNYKEKSSTETQIKKTSESLFAVCNHAGIDELTLFKTISGGRANKVIDKIISEMRKSDISIIVVEAYKDIDEKDLLGCKYGVLAVGKETKIAALRQLNALCVEYDINNVGSIFISNK